jgi:hypothetical protein
MSQLLVKLAMMQVMLRKEGHNGRLSLRRDTKRAVMTSVEPVPLRGVIRTSCLDIHLRSKGLKNP